MRLDSHLGGYPVRFLDQIVRLSKSLKLKREGVKTLRNLNTKVEMTKSFGEYITEDFQRKYASTVLELSHVNRDLNDHLDNIRAYTQEVSFVTICSGNFEDKAAKIMWEMLTLPFFFVIVISFSKFSAEAGPTISLPNIIRESCQEDAYNMVNKNNIIVAADLFGRTISDCNDKNDGAFEKGGEYVENPKILALISSLTALLLQVKQLADGEK